MKNAVTVAELIGTKTVKFGDARVECHDEVTRPFRTGQLIMLPISDNDGDDHIIISLARGTQFYTYNNYDSYARDEGGFFGGTDESPFLSRLNWGKTKPECWGHKEERFFEILKPGATTRLEQALNCRSFRQGDWFATPLPVSKMEEAVLAVTISSAISGRGTQTRVLDGKNNTLGKTRHTLEGEVVEVGEGYIGRGILRAPDHKDQTFDRLHFFAQCDVFYNEEVARKAD